MLGNSSDSNHKLKGNICAVTDFGEVRWLWVEVMRRMEKEEEEEEEDC